MKALKIATVPITDGQTPFWVEKCALSNLQPRKHCPYPGLVAETYKTWLDHLEAPYELIPNPDPHFGEFKNGTWVSGLFGQLVNKEIDFIMEFWAQLPARMELFEFGLPVTTYNLVFAAKSGTLSLAGSAWLLVTVYAYWTWIFLIICLVLCQASIGLNKLGLKSKSRKKFLLVVYSFTLIFFLGTYQNGLLSHLLHTPTKKLFKDPWQLAEMIESRDVKLIARAKTDFSYQSLLYSNDRFMKRLRNAVSDNPVVFEGNMSKALSKALDGKHVLLGTEHQVMIMTIVNCGIETVRAEELPKFRASVMTWKGNPWLAKLNRTLTKLRIHSENLNEKYVNMWKAKKKEYCYRGKTAKPLSMWSLSGAFAALVVSSFSGLLCLLAEKVVKVFGAGENCLKAKHLEIPEDNRINRKTCYNLCATNIRMKRRATVIPVTT